MSENSTAAAFPAVADLMSKGLGFIAVVAVPIGFWTTWLRATMAGVPSDLVGSLVIAQATVAHVVTGVWVLLGLAATLAYVYTCSQTAPLILSSRTILEKSHELRVQSQATASHLKQAVAAGSIDEDELEAACSEIDKQVEQLEQRAEQLEEARDQVTQTFWWINPTWIQAPLLAAMLAALILWAEWPTVVGTPLLFALTFIGVNWAARRYSPLRLRHLLPVLLAIAFLGPVTIAPISNFGSAVTVEFEAGVAPDGGYTLLGSIGPHMVVRTCSTPDGEPFLVRASNVLTLSYTSDSQGPELLSAWQFIRGQDGPLLPVMPCG